MPRLTTVRQPGAHTRLVYPHLKPQRGGAGRPYGTHFACRGGSCRDPGLDVRLLVTVRSKSRPEILKQPHVVDRRPLTEDVRLAFLRLHVLLVARVLVGGGAVVTPGGMRARYVRLQGAAGLASFAACPASPDVVGVRDELGARAQGDAVPEGFDGLLTALSCQ